MLWQAIGAVRDLGRLHDIASILIRYGFGDLVRRIGMAGALERAGRALHWHEPEALARLEPPARVRRALEELGPSFIKLGQILATRVDLFPADWIAEFGKLQDAAPAIPFAELLPQLTEDLGEPPEAVLPRLEPEALAAASAAATSEFSTWGMRNLSAAHAAPPPATATPAPVRTARRENLLGK